MKVSLLRNGSECVGVCRVDVVEYFFSLFII